MWFFYLLVVVIALIIDYLIAKNFAEIAEKKGHIGDTYFWFTFLFGLIGMLMVVALPNQRGPATKNAPVEPTITIPKIAIEKETATATQEAIHRWRCDNCGQMATQSPCEHCGK